MESWDKYTIATKYLEDLFFVCTFIIEIEVKSHPLISQDSFNSISAEHYSL